MYKSWSLTDNITRTVVHNNIHLPDWCSGSWLAALREGQVLTGQTHVCGLHKVQYDIERHRHQPQRIILGRQLAKEQPNRLQN
jgi:hypothetical protein